MKIRWTSRTVRVRLDDLELNALLAGQSLETAARWGNGSWRLVLDPAESGVGGSGSTLVVGLKDVMKQLGDFAAEGVELEGPPRVSVEKDYLPQHLG